MKGKLKDWFSRKMYALGVCTKCGHLIEHELEEPFTYCMCPCAAEDTGKPPLFQRCRLWFKKICNLDGL